MVCSKIEDVAFQETEVVLLQEIGDVVCSDTGGLACWECEVVLLQETKEVLVQEIGDVEESERFGRLLRATKVEIEMKCIRTISP